MNADGPLLGHLSLGDSALVSILLTLLSFAITLQWKTTGVATEITRMHQNTAQLP